jgi:spore coat polysaccharide biosynthesis protein SpsF
MISEMSSIYSKTVGIVQARLSSSRLPEKVVQEISGIPMLIRVVERVRKAKYIDQVIVATTTDISDDVIEILCQDNGYHCYRGDQYDVLDRYYQAAKISQAELIVRITADCPVIDPVEIDRTVEALIDTKADFAANRLPPPWERSYPIGLDTEVCTIQALERAWNEAKLPEQREHVMPYFYMDAGRFRIVIRNHDPNYGHYRWTVDTIQDLQLVREIYARFDCKDDFGWLDVVDLFRHQPDLEFINRDISHKNVHDIDERFGTFLRNY